VNHFVFRYHNSMFGLKKVYDKKALTLAEAAGFGVTQRAGQEGFARKARVVQSGGAPAASPQRG
jgi:hypothetical protein